MLVISAHDNQLLCQCCDVSAGVPTNSTSCNAQTVIICRTSPLPGHLPGPHRTSASPEEPQVLHHLPGLASYPTHSSGGRSPGGGLNKSSAEQKNMSSQSLLRMLRMPRTLRCAKWGTFPLSYFRSSRGGAMRRTSPTSTDDAANPTQPCLLEEKPCWPARLVCFPGSTPLRPPTLFLSLTSSPRCRSPSPDRIHPGCLALPVVCLGQPILLIPLSRLCRSSQGRISRNKSSQGLPNTPSSYTSGFGPSPVLLGDQSGQLLASLFSCASPLLLHL